MTAHPQSFKPQRELILECPDWDAFVSRPVNFRAGHYHFGQLSLVWWWPRKERGIGPLFLNSIFEKYQKYWKMSYPWPPVTRLNVQSKGGTRGEKEKICLCLWSSELMLSVCWKTEDSGLTVDHCPFWVYEAKQRPEFCPIARPLNKMQQQQRNLNVLTPLSTPTLAVPPFLIRTLLALETNIM